jgi:type 1 fimbriae regulatory protein FimB
MLKAQDRRCLDPDEAHRLIEAAGLRGRHPFRDKVLVGLIYRHGMRSSEGVNLRWSEIDLHGGVLHIASVNGGDADRTHHLADDELRDLHRLREQATGSYVFETTRGIPLTVEALQSIIREAGKLAKLDVRSFPDMLRRSTAFALVNDGVDKRLVQAFLGQKDVRRSAPDSAIPPEEIAAVRVR